MVAGVRVEGLSKLRQQFKAAGVDMAEMRDAGKQAAEIVAVEARTRTVPRRSGALAGSVRAAGQVSGGVVRAGGARIRYANVIHFGWAGHNIEPQPFLYEALDNRVSEVEAAYERSLETIIREAGLA